jgi:hypothetical protein
LWSAVYFPLTVSKWLADGNISFPEIARYIVRFFLLGSVIPLWFLIYLVYAVGIVSLLVRTIKIKGMLIIVVASYALGLILTTYSGLFREIPFLDTLIKAGQPVFGPLPGVFFAVPCTVIGFLIARKGTFSQKACLFGAIACFLFYGAECLFGLFVLQTESTVLWIFLLPFCFLIFMLTLQIELPTNQIYRKIRSIGIVLYVSHYFFVEIFSPFFAEGKFASLLLFVAVTAASVILAFLLLRGSKTTKFAWLRYFY